MIVYLIPTGATLLSSKGRVQGWRQSPLDRTGWKSVKGMAHQLRGRGVTRVLTSDLFEQSARLVGRELHVPTIIDQNWRHFNIGRHAGKAILSVNAIVEKAVAQWATDPTIPISGGDSLTSWMTRTKRALTKMVAAPGDCALVLDVRGIAAIRSLTSAGPFDVASLSDTGLDPAKIYLLRFSGASAHLSGPAEPSREVVTRAHPPVEIHASR